MFWFLGHEECGVLALWPGIKPITPALEGEVSTTGPPGKSPHHLLYALFSGPFYHSRPEVSLLAFSLKYLFFCLAGLCRSSPKTYLSLLPLCLAKQWSYSFLPHSKLCLWDLVWHWYTEVKFVASVSLIYIFSSHNLSALEDPNPSSFLYLLQNLLCMCTLSCVRLLCNPRNCNPRGSSVYGIIQTRILEWVAIPSSRGLSWAKDQTHILHWQMDSLPTVTPLQFIGPC